MVGWLLKEDTALQISKETQLEYAMRCLSNSPDGVFWSDSNGVIAYVNEAACKELGYTREELLGMRISEFDVNLTEKDLGAGSSFIQATSSGKIARLQTVHRHRDGHLIPVDITMGVLEAEKDSLGFSFVRDMSEHIGAETKLKKAYKELEKNNAQLGRLYRDLSAREEQLEHLAYHDALTGLPNRTLLMEDLQRITKTCADKAKNTAVLFIDLDNFKNINDGLGHSVGDVILIEAGQRMQENLRKTDIIYRFGGDEFIILLQDIGSTDEISQLAQRISKCLVTPFRIDMISIYLTCSIGVSVFPEHATSPDELLMYADASMYKAKFNGKDRVQFFNRELKREVTGKIDLQNKLRQAILNKELYLKYQPQFNRMSGQIRGVEALIRWENPHLGSISPQVLIPIAEEMGFIVPIGEWVLHQACSDAHKWEKEYQFDGYISVNVSAKQLRNVDFVNTVRQAIAVTGLNPARLELEITESVFIDSVESAVQKLIELKKMGVRICLDDFGTGYSSLGYLIKLPIDTLKIDKAFIEQSQTGADKKNITGAIVSMMSDLGIETIAEGVETQEQFDYVMNTKTSNFQGYLLSRPVMEEVVGRILQKNRQGVRFNGMI